MRSHPKSKKKENKKIRQKKTRNPDKQPHSCVGSEGGLCLLSSPAFGIVVLHSALSLSCVWCCCPMFSIIIPCIHCCHPMIIVVVSSPCCCCITSLVFVLSPSSPLSVISTICYLCCLSCPPFAIPAIHLGVVVWCPHSIVISTSISPCEQLLAGRVVVFCNMAPIATLQAEAHSGSIG